MSRLSDPVPDAAAAGPYAGRSFIIINPKAGQRDPEKLRRRLGAAFAARSASFDIVDTTCAGHAEVLARHAAALGYRAVCVVGGDGTLAEAASGLAGTGTPLALIPGGTANQVALNLGIPRGFEAELMTRLAGIREKLREHRDQTDEVPSPGPEH